MRQLLTIAVLTLFVLGTTAQKVKKPSLSKAKSFMDKGELAEAKRIIDAATTYEKTMNDGKTWYYRALIYSSIDTASNEAISALSDDAFNIALESFNKVEELDNGKGYALVSPAGVQTMDQQINGWFEYYFNKGAKLFEEEEYMKSAEVFLVGSMIIPSDTNCLSNAGYAALYADNDELALEMFNKNIERGAKSKNMLLSMISVHNKKEDYEAALVVLDKAKEFYPTDNMLNRQEVDLLRKVGRIEQAKEQLIVAINNEPENALLPFFLGILYEEDGDSEKAMEWYEKATVVDPTYFDAFFNMGALLYNKGTVLVKEKNMLGYSSADQKKAKAMEPKIKEAFSNALPIWEKMYELNAKDSSVLERLVYMYAFTGQTAKADKVEAELNSLPQEQ